MFTISHTVAMSPEFRKRRQDELSLELERLSQIYSQLDPKAKSRDRAVDQTTQSHLEKAKTFIQNAETFDKARVQLTCARIKLDFLTGTEIPLPHYSN